MASCTGSSTGRSAIETKSIRRRSSTVLDERCIIFLLAGTKVLRLYYLSVSSDEREPLSLVAPGCNAVWQALTAYEDSLMRLKRLGRKLKNT